jgi:hypothetical protein
MEEVDRIEGFFKKNLRDLKTEFNKLQHQYKEHHHQGTNFNNSLEATNGTIQSDDSRDFFEPHLSP